MWRVSGAPVSYRGIEARRALEYARSQGWIPPEQQHECAAFADRLVELEKLNAELTEDHAPLCARRDELVAALETERESHAVTKRALLRARKKLEAP